MGQPRPAVAICWELGGGFGHLTMLRPLVEFFLHRGWRVQLITRDVCATRRIFPESGRTTVLPAPLRQGRSGQTYPTPTFAHILHNVGCGDPLDLLALTESWRTLFGLLGPRMIVAEHSPIALLAARTLSLPAIVYGVAFSLPPDESPLPNLIPGHNASSEQLLAVEHGVLQNLNQALAHWNAPPLSRVTQLLHETHSRCIFSFPELDHYPHRGAAQRLWGHWPEFAGEPPQWPDAEGRRVFAYLKPFKQLPQLLQSLAQSRLPTLVYLDRADAELRRRAATATLRFTDRMTDLRRVREQASVAVTHGNFGTTSAMLLGGVPTICIPLHLEQLLVAQSVAALGAGLRVAPEKVAHCHLALHKMLQDTAMLAGAEAFAAKYREHDQAAERRQLVSYWESLLAGLDRDTQPQ